MVNQRLVLRIFEVLEKLDDLLEFDPELEHVLISLLTVTLHKVFDGPVVSLLLLSSEIAGRKLPHSSVIGNALTTFTFSGASGISAVAD